MRGHRYTRSADDDDGEFFAFIKDGYPNSDGATHIKWTPCDTVAFGTSTPLEDKIVGTG